MTEPIRDSLTHHIRGDHRCDFCGRILGEAKNLRQDEHNDTVNKAVNFLLSKKPMMAPLVERDGTS